MEVATKKHDPFIRQSLRGKRANKGKQIILATQEYLAKARAPEVKINARIEENWPKITTNCTLESLMANELVFFMNMLAKHIDLVERRLIKKPSIPAKKHIPSSRRIPNGKAGARQTNQWNCLTTDSKKGIK
jgi:hypothetical protein